MFSLWETLAARKETDMRICGIMELEVVGYHLLYYVLYVDPIYLSLIVMHHDFNLVSITSCKSASHC